jgi:nitrogen regulatory protein P-II 1
MKKVDVMIKPFRLAEVTDALGEIGICGMTVSEVMGSGRRNKPPAPVDRWKHSRANLAPNLRIEIVVAESQAAEVVKAVIKGARTGRVDDGKIFITDIERAVRIRTGEEGDDAVSDSKGLSPAVQVR